MAATVVAPACLGRYRLLMAGHLMHGVPESWKIVSWPADSEAATTLVHTGTRADARSAKPLAMRGTLNTPTTSEYSVSSSALTRSEEHTSELQSLMRI